MAQAHTIEVPIAGMDCTECTQHVQAAIGALPGVETVIIDYPTLTSSAFTASARRATRGLRR